jgi:PKHD-type hydroxylase
MILTLAHLLPDQDFHDISAAVRHLVFEAGRAGWAANDVKANLQATESMAADAVSERLAGHLLRHALFQLAAQPKRIIGPLLSRYEPGHAYGIHTDEAILDGARSDLAFTLFLSDPSDYDGGDLVLASAQGDDAFKLPAGHAVLYPATTLHQVMPVTRGVRFAAVGWVRSYIRDAGQRELLFDLETARRALFDRHGKTAEFDLLSKCSANLQRRWCDD